MSPRPRCRSGNGNKELCIQGVANLQPNTWFIHEDLGSGTNICRKVKPSSSSHPPSQIKPLVTIPRFLEARSTGSRFRRSSQWICIRIPVVDTPYEIRPAKHEIFGKASVPKLKGKWYERFTGTSILLLSGKNKEFAHMYIPLYFRSSQPKIAGKHSIYRRDK